MSIMEKAILFTNIKNVLKITLAIKILNYLKLITMFLKIDFSYERFYLQ